MTYTTCIRCGSSSIDKLSVGTGIRLYCSEERHDGVTSQKVYMPTDALVCKKCGHVELVIDWDKQRL